MDGIAARSAIPVVTAGLPRQRLDGRLEVTAYYVIAEAVTNAQKHAAATLIRIRGDSTSGGLRLEIDDDGRGGAREVPGSGLEGLRDRVEAIGGTFVIDSPPGRGTRIAVELPAGAMPHASWRPSRDRKERK